MRRHGRSAGRTVEDEAETHEEFEVRANLRNGRTVSYGRKVWKRDGDAPVPKLNPDPEVTALEIEL